ncbi:unnamed protein product [Didymodactylos carnosus]|uniref:WIBG Mago-binding domain-containing protein n=1 Tax=Didymodactylos carnosus TaxID=1234261 RepID=A0A813SMM6_9BILA|nr:unnamed protein product [Didymodactylos carnosus]CAF0951415.1 unnamed protein product [Didymodactylos carnosus]CAF3584023.1 unnamed protein product [Didymodactylos carnosus]CAF3725521.1 unnamed protein product [Didymodactylos carnosus]
MATASNNNNSSRLNRGSNFERQNIVRDEQTGQSFIPGSQRPDGSWRKPIRVKENYVPQDEMPVYQSVGQQYVKSKRLNPIPGLVLTEEEALEQEKQRQKQIEKEQQQMRQIESKMKGLTTTKPELSETDKRIQKIQKVLKSIEGLEKHLKQDNVKPDKSQQEKLQRKPELERELQELLDKKDDQS